MEDIPTWGRPAGKAPTDRLRPRTRADAQDIYRPRRAFNPNYKGVDAEYEDYAAQRAAEAAADGETPEELMAQADAAVAEIRARYEALRVTSFKKGEGLAAVADLENGLIREIEASDDVFRARYRAAVAAREHAGEERPVAAQSGGIVRVWRRASLVAWIPIFILAKTVTYTDETARWFDPMMWVLVLGLMLPGIVWTVKCLLRDRGEIVWAAKWLAILAVFPLAIVVGFFALMALGEKNAPKTPVGGGYKGAWQPEGAPRSRQDAEFHARYPRGSHMNLWGVYKAPNGQLQMDHSGTTWYLGDDKAWHPLSPQRQRLSGAGLYS
jgi:hypothetical protein